MTVMRDLNAAYDKAAKTRDILRRYEKSIKDVINGVWKSDAQRVSASVGLLQDLSKEIDCSEFELIKDTRQIGSQYVNCLNAIDTYKKTLLKTKDPSDSAIRKVLREVTQAQSKFDELKEAFYQKHKYSIDSASALNQVILSSVNDALKKNQIKIDHLKDKAKEILDATESTELRETDTISSGADLPMKLLVARTRVSNNPYLILRDMGISDYYQNTYTDLRNQGNVMVNVDFECMENRKIDEFIIAYVFRFIEAFPIGTVNVHIFDQNTNFLYKRLYNCFQSENAGEITKKSVQIHTTYNDLAAFRDVTCEDIFKKTSVSVPDLYAIYENDRSDPFNLIILRDGLVDGSGYASPDVLDTISSLTRAEETGHKCGLRFLIVDDSDSFDTNLAQNSKHFLRTIRQN